jgi:uncharacterized protein YjdB
MRLHTVIKRTILLLAVTLLFAIPAPCANAYGDTDGALATASYYIVNKKATCQITLTLNQTAENTSNYTYTVSNTKIAKVDATGLITGLKKGATRLTITSKTNPSLTCSTKIYVGRKISRLRLNYTKKTISEGNYLMLKATLSPYRAAYKKLQYTSSNPKVASVSQKGKISANATGTATITVSTLDGSNLSKTCVITVEEEDDEDTEDDASIFPNPFFRNSLDDSITSSN